ncbi:uncharacterized protein ACBT57_023795 [Dama dama]
MAVLSFPIPMAFLPTAIPHPLPAALSRSAISHGMSGASLEPCAPVTALSPARQEPGKNPVTQKPRRRRRAAQRDEHAREKGSGRRSDLHLHVPSPRCSETGTDSSDSSSTRENHWIQAKRRAQVKFRLSRRRRRNNKPSGNLGESSAPRESNPVHLGSEDKKHAELTSCESCSLKLLGAEDTTYEGCGVSLSRSSESKRPSRKQQESGGGDPRGDPQLLHRCGQNERTIKRRFSGTDSSTEMLAVKGGKPAGDAGFQEPPAMARDGSDHLHACRSVSPEKDLMPPKYTSSCCELHVCVCPLPSKHNIYPYCYLPRGYKVIK